MRTLLLLLLLMASTQAQSWSPGILLQPIKVGERSVGEAGQLVWFQYGRVRIGAEVYESWAVIPDQLDVAPAMAVLWLEQEPLKSRGDDIRERYLLATRVAYRFRESDLREELVAKSCRYALRMDDYKEKPRLAVRALEGYLATYPQGLYRDEMEWALVQVKTEPYEYEGVGRLIIGSAVRYEAYLAMRPNSSQAEKVRLRIARLYRMASECKAVAETQRWRERATEIYSALTSSPDRQVRCEARVALYNLKRGRRCYVNPNDIGRW